MSKNYIVRAKNAGVFFGNIKERKENEVTMTNVRKLWYWDGANSVEDLAVFGVKYPDKCKFTIWVDEMIIAEPIQIIQATEKADKSISEVQVWTI